MHNSAILQSLPLLADALGRAYGVAVEIGGTDAYTTGKVIRLPGLPAEADATFLGLVRGYIDHEAAHVRFTEFRAISQADTTPLERHIWNIFEDWRVEAKLASYYPGCRQNFTWLIRHLFLERASTLPSGVAVVLDWLLLTVRSWSVPELATRCREAAALIDRQWPGLRPDVEPILERMRGHCPDSLACLDYARQVIRSLKEATPSPGQNPSPDLAISTDIQSLISAGENDLPDDFGQVLRKFLGRNATEINRLTVAIVGNKPRLPTDAKDRAAIDHAIAGLRARLHGLVQSSRMVRHKPARAGKIDTRRLHGVAVGNPRVFATHQARPAINTALHVLLDTSGSMRERIGLANQCCRAVAQAMALIGVSVGITAFPGSESGTVVPLLRHGERPGQYQDVGARGMTPMGEALWWVLQRLSILPEQRRMVLIITDGSPDGAANVRAAIKAAAAQGVEVYGLGIESSHITTLLPGRSRVIATIGELPGAVFSMLEQTLV